MFLPVLVSLTLFSPLGPSWTPWTHRSRGAAWGSGEWLRPGPLRQRPQPSLVASSPSASGGGGGRRGSGPATQLRVGSVDGEHLTVTTSVSLFLPSPYLREQTGSPDPGDPRDTLEPKVMKEQEDSMGPQDPLACR